MKIRILISVLLATTLFTTSSYAVTPTPKPTTKVSKTATPKPATSVKPASSKPSMSSSSTTTKKDVRVRARQIALEVANITTGEDWKLGTFRLDIHPGGRR